MKYIGRWAEADNFVGRVEEIRRDVGLVLLVGGGEREWFPVEQVVLVDEDAEDPFWTDAKEGLALDEEVQG